MIFKNYPRKFFIKLKESLNEFFIPFLVKNEMFYILVVLFVLNISKIKKILPKKKIRYKVIVLGKLGGNEDLYISQKKYNISKR